MRPKVWSRRWPRRRSAERASARRPRGNRDRRARAHADAVDRAGALHELRHRSDDERAACGACGDKRDRSSSSPAAITGMPTAFLVDAGSGALTLGVPTSPGVAAAAAALHAHASLQRSAIGRVALAEQPGPDRRRHRRARWPATWASSPPQPGFSTGSARCATPRRAAGVRRGDHGLSCRHRGGAQALYGVRPDLTCLGKIIGGGLPVGAYGGRADLMSLVAPAGPVYQAGTLSGNPLGDDRRPLVARRA